MNVALPKSALAVLDARCRCAAACSTVSHLCRRLCVQTVDSIFNISILDGEQNPMPPKDYIGDIMLDVLTRVVASNGDAQAGPVWQVSRPCRLESGM